MTKLKTLKDLVFDWKFSTSLGELHLLADGNLKKYTPEGNPQEDNYHELTLTNPEQERHLAIWMDEIQSAVPKEINEQLKQEAIEWVKVMKGKKDFCLNCGKEVTNTRISSLNCPIFEHTTLNQDYESTDVYGAIKILKYIFNITEEDLK